MKPEINGHTLLLTISVQSQLDHLFSIYVSNYLNLALFIRSYIMYTLFLYYKEIYLVYY